jgi:hypothetical protein
MAIGDYYEIVDKQDFYGREVLNVYHYEQREVVIPLSGNVASVFAENWRQQILPSITAIQCTAVVHNSISCRNLFDAADYHEILHSQAGALTQVNNDPLPAWSNFVVKTQGEGHTVRPGRKQITGVLESYGAWGQVNNAGYVTLGVGLAVALKKAVTSGLLIQLDTWAPIIIQRIKEADANSLTYRYRLPQSQGEGVASRVVTSLFALVLSTTNSRKD